MRIRCVTLPVLCFLVIVFPLQSGTEEPTFQPNSNLDIWVPFAGETIRIDGMLDDAGWRQAVKIGHFSEIVPGDNVQPSVQTEVFVTYDQQALYVAFHCYDEPATIRATLSDRDIFRADDIIFIILDTFRNYQTAYQLGVNPFGLQVDMYRNLDEQDATFDIVYHSAGRIVEDGWVAEMAVPFKSLRFPEREEQMWGFHCIRVRPRESREEMSWAPLDRDDPCFLCQAGVLRGIRGVSGGRNLEILPYVMASQVSGLSDVEDPETPFENKDIEADGGFNVKYGLTSDITLDFAYDPDFSQVESDMAQIDINTSFALFYPEKRPFFLEGSDLFASQIQAVYTRTINDPIAAAKLTGHLNNTSIGYIFAKDDNTPFIIPFQEQSVFLSSRVKSVASIFRLKHNLWEDSFIGILGTSRDVGSGYNRLAGMDASLRFLSDYRFSVQALQSWTEEPNDTTIYEGENGLTFDGDRFTSAFDGDRFHGLGLYATMSRAARHWNFRLFYRDLSPAFRADNGFVDRNDFRTLGAWTGLLFRPDNRWFDQIYPQIIMNWRYDHGGIFRERWIGPECEFLLKTQTNISIGALVVNDEHFQGEWHKGVHRGWIRTNTNFSEFLSGGVSLMRGEFIYRGDSTDVGSGHEFDVNATAKFSSRFALETTYEWDRLSDFFDGYILRAKAVYQFTPGLFLRLVAQFNSFDDTFEIDPLISYKINPFTVFYAGSTYDLVDFDRPTGWRTTGRQFFMKFQYFWRL
jgi:hypothetical protein